MIPVTLLVTTRNEAANIEKCLRSAHLFIEQIFVIDSDSDDETASLSRQSAYASSASRYSPGLVGRPVSKFTLGSARRPWRRQAHRWPT